MSIHPSIVSRLAIFCIAALLSAIPARAEPPAEFPLKIEVRTLEDGLNEFARQTGLQVIFRSEQARGLRAPAVVGTFAAQAALDRLLAQSGLSYRFVNARTIAIESPRQSTRAEPADAAELRLARAEGELSGISGPANRASTGSSDEVTVTGTRDTGIVNQGVIPREENQAVRYTIISREDIERTGVTTMPELMRRVTGNQETGTTTQRMLSLMIAGTGLTLSSGDQVDLRGLGNNQTLIMINGRRIYAGDSVGGPDISRIPLSAVERVEILPSSGSAMYGANSVGGVVNIVMRQGYQGTEIGSYVGASTAGGAEEYRLDLFKGISFNDARTNLTAALGVQRFGEIERSQRDYDDRVLSSLAAQQPSTVFMNTILPNFISGRGVILTASALGLGVPSNPTAKYAAIPAGSSGIGLTPSSFNGATNTAFLSTDRIGRSKLRQPSSNYSIMLNADHAILGDSLGAYSELTWREDDSSFYLPSANVAVFLSATDARNPFRSGVTNGFVGRAVTVYRDPADLPDSYQRVQQQTARAVLGLKGKWARAGGQVYNWAVDGSWDQNEVEAEARMTTTLLNTASRAGVYNIYRDLNVADPLPAAEADKHRYEILNRSRPTITAGNFRLNGDLFPMWGGPAKFSLGSEYRRERNVVDIAYPYIGEYNYLTGGLGPFLVAERQTNTARDVMSAYAEVVLPVIGAGNRHRWMHSLDVSAGIRYEKYDDFNAAKPPLAAVKFGLTPDVALRVSYAEGFQPPTVAQLQSPRTVGTGTGSIFVDPLRPGVVNPNYTQVRSGNPDLLPETAQTWDAGVIFTPRALPGLTLNAAYFRYDKKDNIIFTLPIAQAVLFFPELIVRGPANADDIAAGRPGPVTQYNSKPVNLARQFTDGVDASIRYRLPDREWGRLTFMSASTWTKRFFSVPRPDAAPVDSLALVTSSLANFTLEHRNNSTVMWSRDLLTMSFTGTYTGGFESSTTRPTARNPAGSGIDGDSIGGQWTFDIQADYMIPAGGEVATGLREWLGGTRWTVGAINLFDTAPDLWTDRTRGYTSPFVDVRQRFVYLQVRKTF